ncbi:MAG: DUF2844 domain-containing protein [Ferrovum myxofaciens]|uniref:DUF2844 domain-containing protein n=2 Tax=Ferrovum myxofaciens TaxID=416213 RepID=UPI002352FA6B|nr:DUF2844 domain-containing protein [Ferrovum myxofaciens]QKE41887.1 MAG: DUF2844 domain-containing protein [Ferrovum myxofaciens]
MVRVLWSLGVLGLMVSLKGWAALGGNDLQVPQEGFPLTSYVPAHAASASPPGGIRQQSVETLQHVIVTEYSSHGTVFALTWSGPTLPDSSVFLGSYFPQYQQSLQNLHLRPGSYRTPIALHTPALVVHASGHMGAYQGSAYAPALLPAGLDLSLLGVAP